MSLTPAMLIETLCLAASMILTYRYRLLPTKEQHRALEAILESQRQLYNAALEDVHDASWAKFISFLRYKAARAGARLIEVNPRNTTQDCSRCGERVPKGLGDRQHDCPHCGLSIDRDVNAARNILHRAGVRPGLRNVAGCGMRAGGNLNELPRRRQETEEPN